MPNGLWLTDSQFMPFASPQGFLTQEIATRDRAPDFLAIHSMLPNPDPVLKKMGKDIEVYRELLSDAHLGAVEESRKSGVGSREWELDRGKSKSRPARLIEDMLRELDMDRIISEILDAPLYGYQPLEVLWAKTGDYLLPIDVVGKPPEWFHFWADNTLRLRTRDNPMGIELSPRKFLLPRHRATYQNPYGFPLLSRCFWSIAMKKGGIKWWITFVEKYGMPFAVGKLPRGTKQPEVQKLLRNLNQMVQDAVAVIPDDASVELKEAAGKTASSDLYKDLCTFHNAEISKAIIGHGAAADSTPGKLGGEDSGLAVRGDIIMKDTRLVEATMNQLIRWIMEVNFPTSQPPKFCFYEEEEVNKLQAERDEVLHRIGVRFKPKYIQEQHGLEEDDFELIEEEKDPAGEPAAPGGPLDIKARLERMKAAGREPVLSDNAKSLGFAEKGGDDSLEDQEALDKALSLLTAEQLQAFSEGLLKPVFNLIEKGGSLEEIGAGLAAAYPAMQDAAFEKALGQALFVSELWGRLNAKA
jgi:phage gp29-like protein